MTESNGFLNFNTPEDYLAYQDRLITNWERYHEYKGLTGGTMLSETYRQTGRTYSALKCAVDLAMRPDTELVLFITHQHRGMSDFRHYPFFENYAHQHFPYNHIQAGKIKFVSYNKLVEHIREHFRGLKTSPDYVIYDHQVFETCVPGYIARNRVRTPAEEAYKKLHGMYPCYSTDWEIFEEAFNLGVKEASK